MIDLTIITVCLNSENTIERTIKSVIKQNVPNFEYIIIDGCSSDGTIEIIRKYTETHADLIKFISEKDEGLYHAMNKGVVIAKGDLIGIINADDYYLDDVLEEIYFSWKNSNKPGIISGNTLLLEKNNSESGSLAFPFIDLTLKKVNIPHPSTFVSKAAYLRHGGYELNLKYASDKEFFYRLINSGESYLFLDKTIACFSQGGMGSRIGLKGFRENYIIDKKYRNILFASRILLTNLIIYYSMKIKKSILAIRKYICSRRKWYYFS